MARALEMCAEHGGAVVGPRPGERSGGDAVGSWREAFLGAPYMRDVLVAMGVLAETFETAITWERFPAFHERVMRGRREAVREVCWRRGGRVLCCRFTHVYPDGPAPYFTVLAPGAARRGGRAVGGDQAAPSRRDDRRAGATITHHHAVGRDHRPLV